MSNFVLMQMDRSIVQMIDLRHTTSPSQECVFSCLGLSSSARILGAPHRRSVRFQNACFLSSTSTISAWSPDDALVSALCLRLAPDPVAFAMTLEIVARLSCLMAWMQRYINNRQRVVDIHQLAIHSPFTASSFPRFEINIG